MAPQGGLNEIKNLTHRLYSARQVFCAKDMWRTTVEQR